MDDDWKFRALKEPLVPRQRGESKEAFERRIDEERIRKLNLLLDSYKIPRDDPVAGWKLAIALVEEKYSGFRLKKPAGAKRDPSDTVRDMILLRGIFVAKQKDPEARIVPTIRALARYNEWPTNEEHIDTLRRRYYRLVEAKYGETKEFILVAEMAERLLPSIEKHFRDKKTSFSVRH